VRQKVLRREAKDIRRVRRRMVSFERFLMEDAAERQRQWVLSLNDLSLPRRMLLAAQVMLRRVPAPPEPVEQPEDVEDAARKDDDGDC
jgi:hypothetical protein